MGRSKGTFDFSANFEGIVEGPIDAKQVVQTKADLILPATWEDGASAVWLYNGMMVGVGEDPITIQNGIYLLLDKDNYTLEDSWINVGSPIQNLELVTRTIYCDPAGSDTTGDGTIGLPFRQPKRAYEDIGTIIGLEIIVHLNAGTYEWNQDTATALQTRTVVNGNITTEGDWTVIHPTVTWTATSPNRMLYDVVATGVTVVADELVGLFKHDGSKWDPISYNQAGSDNFQVEASRPSRNGSKPIEQHATIIEVTGEFVLDLTYYNDVSSEINFESLRFNQVDGDNMHFEYHGTSMWFQGCYLDVPKGIIIGQFSMSWNQEYIRFDRCYMVHDGSDQRLIQMRRTAGFINFNRTVFDGRNSIPTTIGVFYIDGKNISVTLLTCIFRGPGAGYAAIDGSNYFLNISDDWVVRDFEHVFRQYKGFKCITPFTTTNPKAATIFENISYLANTFEQEFSVNLDIQKWTGKVAMFGDGHVDALIAPQDKVNIQIAPDAGHFPEISRGLGQTGIPVNLTTWITVGDITINHMVEVTFSGRRLTTGFAGKEMLQVNGGVLVANTIAFQVAGVPGVTITSQLSGNNIQIGVVVDNSSANLVDFLYSVQRTLLP